MPPDAEIRKILTDRVGAENLGIGMVVGVIDAKARLPDGAPGGSPVRIVTEAGTRLLTARYHFPTSVEAILKTFDGVVSVREEFDPPEADPRQSAAARASG